MLYVALVQTRPERAGGDLTEKSRAWWNGGDKPSDLRVHGFFGTLSAHPNVFVFSADSHDSIAKMLEYWPEVSFEIFPAQDLVEVFRAQGMEVEAQPV